MQRRVRRETTTTRERFYYCSTPEKVEAILSAIIGFIVLVIAINFSKRVQTEEELMVLLIIGFTDFLIFIITICALCNIKTGSYQILTITDTEVKYQHGWISKKTQTIPLSKIKSCSKKSGILQRLCGSMDIGITTAGDIAEINFRNIENGDKAYELISRLIKQYD